MRYLRPADYAVIAAATLLVVVLAALAWRPAVTGTRVEIRSVAQDTLTLDLTVDTEVRVRGRLGDSVITVADGRVRFTGAPCRNRVCLASGWLRAADDFAACVPNGVTVRVTGPAARYDSIHY